MLVLMEYEDEQPPFSVDLVLSTRPFFTGARVSSFKEKLREDLMVKLSLGALPNAGKCLDHEHPEKISASKTIVRELLQKIADMKGTSKSSEPASSQVENCPECDDTVIKDHFSFRLKEEVIRDDAMNSHFESVDAESREEGFDNGSSVKPNSSAETLALSSLFTKRGNTNQVAQGDKTDARFDQDDLMAKFASVFKQQIEDALEPLRGPIAFVFQSREEAERKRRENFLALEEKKLALRRKKLQSLRPRRGGRCQRRWRASSAKLSRQGTSTEVCSDALKFCHH